VSSAAQLYTTRSRPGLEIRRGVPEPGAGAAAAAGAKGVILACAAGGTLRGTTNFPDGQASRSLMAARELLRLEDVSKGRLAVAHLQGGVSAWVAAGNAGEGTGEWSARKGRVPSVGGTKLTAARKLGVAARLAIVQTDFSDALEPRRLQVLCMSKTTRS
jgi:hypothetical protein